MRGGLREKDLVAVLEASRACAAAEDPACFAKQAVAGLHTLVACDIAAYDEVDTASGAGWGCADPAVSPEGYEIFWAHAADNPLVLHAVRAPEDAPRAWSELASTSQLRRTDLYNLLYRPMGVANQMAACLPGSGRTVVGLTVSRASADFSDHDRAVLDVYRHQLADVRRLVVASSRLARAVSGAGLVTLVLDHWGQVISMAGPGPQPAQPGCDEVVRLPEALASWIKARRAGPGEPAEARWSSPGEGDSTWAAWLPGPAEDLLVVPESLLQMPSAQREPPALRVQVLGAFSVQAEGVPLAVSGRAAQVVALVAACGGQVAADTLVEALWPEVDPDIGHNRLRTVLARVPHQPRRLLVRRGDSISLAPDTEIDASVFEAACTRALAGRARGEASWTRDALEALGAYRGHLLADGPAEGWAFATGEHLRRRYLLLLDALAAEAASGGDRTGALDLLERAIQADPGDESRYLAAAELLAAQDRRGAALGMLAQARQVLADLGLPLPARLRTLEATLRA